MADRSRGPTPGATPEHSGAHQNHLGVPPMGRDSMFKFGGDSDRRTVTPAVKLKFSCRYFITISTLRLGIDRAGRRLLGASAFYRSSESLTCQ